MTKEPEGPSDPLSLTILAPSTNTGNNKCNRKRCKCYQEMVTSNRFEIQITGKKYHTRHHIQDKNLVYLISCKMCSQQYVGERENALHMRMSEERSNIRTRKTEKKSYSPLLPTGPHCGGPVSEADREDPQEQHTVVKRKRELLDLHTHNAVSTRAESG